MGHAGDDADVDLMTIVPARDKRNCHVPDQMPPGQVSAKGGHGQATGGDPRGRTWGPKPTTLSTQAQKPLSPISVPCLLSQCRNCNCGGR